MDTSGGGLPPRQGPRAGKPAITKRKKSGVSPTRNLVGLILLLVLVPVGLIEFKANRDYNQAMEKLNATIGKESGDLRNQEEIEKMIGKTPDRPFIQDVESNTQSTTYTWRGVFKSRSIKVYYTLSRPPGLTRFEVLGVK
jgi:hypothetical protein